MKESLEDLRTYRSLATAAIREPDLLDLGRIFGVIRQRWKLALLLALVLPGLVGWVLLREKPLYSAATTLLVERSTDRVVDIKQVVDNNVDSSLTDALLLTHIQQIKSHSFLARVVASLTIEEKAEMLALYPPTEKISPVAGGQTADPDSGRLEALILQSLTVDRINRTLLLTIAVRYRSPHLAQFLANKLGEEYILYLIDRSSSSNDSALAFLAKQADQLRQTVQASEQKVQAYREANNLFFLEQNQNIIVEKLRALSASVTQARVARLALDARLAQVEVAVRDKVGTRQLSSLPEFSGFAAVQKQLDELHSKRDVMAARYQRLHPKMVENASSIAALEKLQTDQLVAALADLRNQRDKATTDEKQLAIELAAAEKDSLRLDQLAVEYNFLRREVETTRTTYTQILGRLNETTISSRLQNTNIKLADPASLPVLPVSPSRLKIGAVVAGLSLLILVGYPLFADSFDKRIRSWMDLENRTGVPLLGEIGRTRKIPEKDRAWLVSRHPDSIGAEEFRGLYNQVQLSSKAPRNKVILITSTIPSEGKSFVAANLATSFASHGHRTLLVDADFRRPSLHRVFGAENDHGYLAWSAARVRDSDARDDLLGLIDIAPGLKLLRSGGVSRKLTEIVESESFSHLLIELRKQFAVIIIDTSPAGVFPDTDALCAFADEILYVCRFEGPNRMHVAKTVDRLRRRNTTLLGAVLNGTKGQALSYYTTKWSGAANYYASYERPRA